MSDTIDPNAVIPEGGDDSEPVDNGLPPGAHTPEANDEVPQEPQQQRRNVQVPVQEVQAERDRRRSAESRVQELERLMETGNKRLADLLEGMNTQRDVPRETPLPDVNVDPVGHFAELSRRQEVELRAIKERQTQFDQVSQQQRQQQEFASRYQNDMRSFAAKNPEAKASYDWLFGQLGKTLPAEAVQALELQTVQNAWKAGENPVEKLHALAVSMGFRSNHGSRQPIVAGPSGEETLEVIRRGQERASASLSNGSANGNPFAGVTYAKVAAMTDEEWARLPAAVRARALGG